MKPLPQWLDSLAGNHTPDFDECVAYLADYFPLLNEFADTEQDNIWHAEGDVAIHTNMVLTELYSLLSSQASHIQGELRQGLVLSALLHDIAKPLTTRRKEILGRERVIATGHEEAGANYLALRLMALPLSHRVISMIMGLVGFHQMPKRLVIKNADFSEYFKLSLNADLELLYWLEVADLKGRICDDFAGQLDLLEQFKMFAQEYRLWQNSHPQRLALSKIQVKDSPSEQAFIDGYAIKQWSQGDIHSAEEAVTKNYLSCQHYSHFYVMCGLSGSGKTSWIANNLKGFEVISLDQIRAELNGKRECQKKRGQVLQLAKLRLKRALAAKRNVVWDATNIRKDFRSVLCDLGDNYNALVTIVAFQQKLSRIYKNNNKRRHAVSYEVLEAQQKKLEWPWRSEAHRMLVIGEKGQELLRQGTFL
ncbi:hypothetical protein BS333_03945 [Vibrio azureus]|uniref:HD domain-containing protein n=1 Tax=Vibrio azureus NBRC 104587 TaxID=1219077 RepID=U3AUG3_9VIBR|nr:AAA family ATPase [Vibrio azureus]AUI85586.1 hypothetical protein BS333_03945 [Vibrio azureus]GAD77390.1 hypothetical protein VAZ01S_073_00230 [Vibrio azureus NBRC 104587]